MGVAFTPDGQRLASLDYDGMLRMWGAPPGWGPNGGEVNEGEFQQGGINMPLILEKTDQVLRGERP
jgi:hypothetical protein